jgi:hypothetical protein
MPWYPCCCLTNPPPPPPCSCDDCSTESNPLSIYIAGLGGVTCNVCTDYLSGGTYAIYRENPACCCWSVTNTFWCSGLGYGYYLIRACVTTVGMSGNLGWEVTFTISVAGITDIVTFIWDSGDTVPFDCTATRTLVGDTIAVDPDGPICEGYDTMSFTINP